MIYITKQVVFKKESQTFNTIIKDKQVQAKKKIIRSLQKTHNSVSTQLIRNRHKYEQQNKSYMTKYQKLINQQKIANSGLLKLKIRKFRLQSIENPKIKQKFGDELKKYLKTWAEVKKHNFIVSVGGVQNYQKAQKCVRKIETFTFIKPIIRNIVFKKKITIWNQTMPQLQKVFFCIKRNLNLDREKYESQINFPYKLEICSITGPYFFVTHLLTQEQYQKKLPRHNPLYNLITLPKKKIVYFLSEYFQIADHVENIKMTLTTFKNKMDVLRQFRKIIFFKRMNLTNIFQSVYSVPTYENLMIESLIVIKRRTKRKRTYPSKQGSYVALSGTNSKDRSTKNYQQQECNFLFCCEPIKAYHPKFMFSISDQTVLKNFCSFPESFIEYFLSNYMIQLNVIRPFEKNQQKSQTISGSKMGISLPEKSNAFVQNSQQSKHQGYFDENNQNQLQKLKPRLIKVIDFGSKQNMKKIVKVQSAVKMRLQMKKYRIDLQNSKSSCNFGFMCKLSSNIMASAYIKGQQIKFFVQCLSLSSQKINKPDHFLKYPKKYWNLAEQFVNSVQFSRIMTKCLVWQVEEDIAIFFEQIIYNFQAEEEKINQMKPIKAIHRLRRLLIKIKLRIQRNKNILYICKIQKQFGTLVIIFRRSPFLKNIVDIFLYVIGIKQRQLGSQTKNRSTNQISEQYDLLSKTFKQANNGIHYKFNEKLKSEYIIQPNIKIRYQKISVFAENAEIFVKNINQTSKLRYNSFQKSKSNRANEKSIQNQFYITQNFFLLKPLHLQSIKNQYRFIERFASVSLDQEQMLNEMENLSLMKNSYDSYQQKKKTIFCQKALLGFIRQDTTAKSNGSISFERCSSDEIEQNLQQQNLIFYSLYRDKKCMFYLQIFIIAISEGLYYFKQVHKQEISKRQIQQSKWSFIYRLIANWIKISGWNTKLIMKNKKNIPKQYANNYHIIQNKQQHQNIDNVVQMDLINEY